MFVFDEYFGLVNMLYLDWKCIDKWIVFNVLFVYYIRYMFVYLEFRNEFEENFNV